MKTTPRPTTPFEIFTFAITQGWKVVLQTGSGAHMGNAMPARRARRGMPSLPYRIKQGSRMREFGMADVTAVDLA